MLPHPDIRSADPPRKYGRGLIAGAARIRIYERDNYTCARCCKRFDRPDNDRYAPTDPTYTDRRGTRRICQLEIDHIHPRRHGGDNNPANLQSLCTQCNARKGSRRS